jgi:hypothetical protein
MVVYMVWTSWAAALQRNPTHLQQAPLDKVADTIAGPSETLA